MIDNGGVELATSYEVFINAFLKKVTEYDFITLDEEIRDDIVISFLKHACARFNYACNYNLYDFNDETREFNFDISEEDIDDMVDIISEGMIVQWMKPYVYKAENYENVLNTADYETYSPAELLYRITETYKMLKNDFSNLVKNYSYEHGDLTTLYL